MKTEKKQNNQIFISAFAYLPMSLSIFVFRIFRACRKWHSTGRRLSAVGCAVLCWAMCYVLRTCVCVYVCILWNLIYVLDQVQFEFSYVLSLTTKLFTLYIVGFPSDLPFYCVLAVLQFLVFVEIWCCLDRDLKC